MANSLAEYFKERRIIQEAGLPRWHGIASPSEGTTKDFATVVQQEALHDRAAKMADNPDPMYREMTREGSALDLPLEDEVPALT